jgi:hypothetical protein
MRGVPFRMPNIQSLAYDTGYQPFNPGESDAAFFPAGQLLPWPRVVGTINALANDPGTAHMRAPLPVVNQYAPFPANYLFLSGVVGKSQG